MRVKAFDRSRCRLTVACRQQRRRRRRQFPGIWLNSRAGLGSGTGSRASEIATYDEAGDSDVWVPLSSRKTAGQGRGWGWTTTSASVRRCGARVLNCNNRLWGNATTFMFYMLIYNAHCSFGNGSIMTAGRCCCCCCCYYCLKGCQGLWKTGQLLSRAQHPHFNCDTVCRSAQLRIMCIIWTRRQAWFPIRQ